MLSEKKLRQRKGLLQSPEESSMGLQCLKQKTF